MTTSESKPDRWGWARRLGPILASVAMLALAFPPFNLSLLVFVALVPWLVSLRGTSAKGAVKSGYTFGLLYFLFQMFWIMPFVLKWTGNLVSAMLPWVVASLIAGLFYALAGWLIHRAFSLKWVWAVPFVWTGIEALRAYVPGLAFPWGIVALPLGIFPGMVQHAALGTIFLVSAWVVLANLIVMEFFFPRVGEDGKPVPLNPRVVLRYSLTFVGFFVFSAVRFGMPVEITTKTFTLGQPGVDMAFQTPEEESLALYNATPILLAGAMSQQSDLLILPEGYAGRVAAMPPETPLTTEPPVPVMMGGQRTDILAEGQPTYQTAFVWDGKNWEYADKTRLVVFGEYVPLRDQLPILQQFNLPAGDLTAADELKTPQIGDFKAGPLICFEGIFPDLAAHHTSQGAQVLIQMSIDDWYEETPAWDQLWMSTVWRSIESGVPILRVGARGKTLATDARGRLLGEAPVGRAVPMRVDVGIPNQSDAFDGRMGFVYLTWAMCFVVGLWGVFVTRLARKLPEASVPK